MTYEIYRHYMDNILLTCTFVAGCFAAMFRVCVCIMAMDQMTRNVGLSASSSVCMQTGLFKTEGQINAGNGR